MELKLNIKEVGTLSVKTEDVKIILEPLKVLGRVIEEPYDEKRDEKLVETWLKSASG